jgi:MYXO-CTERM domain-containing protein
MSSARLAAALLVLVAGPTVAAAHIQLTNPAPRTLELKRSPCGLAGSTRGTNVIVLAPGAQLEVRWNETINHPGHYRIAFDDSGQDFPVPPTATGSTMGMPTVLMDMIADIATPGASYRQMITLPNITCESCTLQVLQLMTDKPPYTVDALSDDIYYQCADIALRMPGGGGDAGTDASAGPDAGQEPDGGVGATDLTGGCGCRTSHGQPSGIALAALALGIATRRRRRV